MEEAQVGRPTKYRKEYCQAIVDFFTVEEFEEHTEQKATASGKVVEVTKRTPAGFPSIQGFAASIGVCNDTIYEWRKHHVEFSEAIKKGQALQEKLLVKHAMSGGYAQAFAIFFAKNNMGWKDKIEQEVIQREPVKIQICEWSEEIDGADADE